MKTRRQQAILDLISNQSITTQTQLADILRKQGFKITQATISRDIKELGLIKVPTEDNVYRYAAAEHPSIKPQKDRLKRLFKDNVIKMDYSENLIVIKTLPGGAQGVASAIDTSKFPQIIGTVGGDDTILIIVKPKKAVEMIYNRFNEFLTMGEEL